MKPLGVVSMLGKARLSGQKGRAFSVLVVTVGMMIGSFAAPLMTPASAAISKLQTDVNALQAAGNTGVLAEIRDHGTVTDARAGVAERGTTQPVPFDAHFRTGSITKTFVSAVVLQLVAEGRLSLDDTVEHLLPNVIKGNGNDGTTMTLRQLMNHTSGLFDYANDSAFFATLSTPSAFLANRDKHYSPQQLIDIALSHAPNFAAGTSYSYSSTNYIVIGEIIQNVTGLSWDTQVTNRIIIPLGLTGTTAPGDVITMPAPYAHGYHIYTSTPASRVYTDTTDDNMTWGGSAGALITTTRDENIFYSALLAGQVLAPAQLAQMKTLVSTGAGSGYGLGIAWSALSCSAAGFWYHTGGTVGYTTVAAVLPNGTRSVVLSLSTTTFTETTYNNNSNAGTNTLIQHVFCG
jgi:D-alanyl-D-alanine carboxypeptidase